MNWQAHFGQQPYLSNWDLAGQPPDKPGFTMKQTITETATVIHVHRIKATSDHISTVA